MKIVVLGLSITSSWGNGHATTYRALLKALAGMGHDITFLERDTPWYASHRDMPAPAFCTTRLYGSLEELRQSCADLVAEANAVVVGSYVPDGVAVGDWALRIAGGAVAFYDIDTPVTLEQLARGSCTYLEARQIPNYDLYLSFTGGPTLERLQAEYGSPRARSLYCAVDPELYRPQSCATKWDLGYLGTYSDDRQPTLERLMNQPARRLTRSRMVVAGPQYPGDLEWPPNVQRIAHVAPSDHRAFYCSQRATLNVTRRAMRQLGHAPSVRLFEAAACGVPVISDRWQGIEEVLTPGREVLIADSADDVVSALHPDREAMLRDMGALGRERILRQHTASHRAAELGTMLDELTSSPRETAS